MFQFLIGRLKTYRVFRRRRICILQFQFLIGRLKTQGNSNYNRGNYNVSIPYRQAQNVSIMYQKEQRSVVSIPYRQAQNIGLLVMITHMTNVSIPYRQAQNKDKDKIVLFIFYIVSIPYRQAQNGKTTKAYCKNGGRVSIPYRQAQNLQWDTICTHLYFYSFNSLQVGSKHSIRIEQRRY